jgi:hypothetical protein
MTDDVRRRVLRRNTAGVLPYVVATVGAAAVTPYITLAICAAIAIFYALPATTSDVAQQS